MKTHLYTTKAIFCLLLLVLISTRINAVTKTSTGTTWGLAANWSPSGIPAAGDYVIINSNMSTDLSSTAAIHGLRVNSGFTFTIGVGKDLNMEGVPAYIIIEAGGVLKFSHKTNGVISWAGGTTLDGQVTGGRQIGTLSTGGAFYSRGSADFAAWDGVLPVTLISFTGSNANGHTILNWESAKESEHGYYNVQRSNDAVNFENIAKVAPQTNAGIRSYQYADEMTANGNVYYRLEMVANDGSVEYSNIVKMTQNASFNVNDISLYPNPAKAVLNIKGINGNVSYSLVDMLGQTCQTGTLGNGQQSINTTNIIPGTYIIRISDAVNTKALSFIKE